MILLIDDERRYTSDYILALESNGLDVKFESDVSSALDTIKASKNEIELIVLDIMMPTSCLDKEKTDGGMRTGYVLFDKIREIIPDVFIIILTNVGHPDLEDKFLREPNCEFYGKGEFLPFGLAEKIKSLLKK